MMQEVAQLLPTDIYHKEKTLETKPHKLDNEMVQYNSCAARRLFEVVHLETYCLAHP